MKDHPSFTGTNMSSQIIKTNESITTSSFESKSEQVVSGKICQMLKITIIAVIVTLVLFADIFILVNFLKKNKSNSNTTTIINIPSNIPEITPPISYTSIPITDSPTISIPTTIINNNNSSDSDEENTEIIKTINEALNKTEESLLKLTEIFNDLKISFNESNISLNKSFFNNTNDTNIEIILEDLIIYNSKFVELIERVNNLTTIIVESILNLPDILKNISKNVNMLIEDYKNISNYLLSVYNLINSLKQSRIRWLISDENFEQFKEEFENLNNSYNLYFNFIRQVLETFYENILDIPNTIIDLNQNLNKSIFEYMDLLNQIEEFQNITEYITEIHNILLSIKQLFLDIKNNMNEKKDIIEDKINFLKELYSNKTFGIEEFKNETNNITENIFYLVDSIMDGINKERKKNGENPIIITKPILSSLIWDSFINSMNTFFEALINIEILKQNEIISIIIIINVEQKTSLDLLFVMDITGSMGPYIDEAKYNIIEIIDGIIYNCPGIDINLGFVGYRDEEEENFDFVVDIEFTKNHSELKDIINSVYAYGGGDLPEDVSWGFEKALNKTWKNNARFIVFVADAPNHGLKYGGDDYNITGRTDLEELIIEAAENGISLFCLNIDDYYTKIMFEVFENVYKNYTQNQFEIVPLDLIDDFSNVVVNSAIKVYREQRMKDKSI